MDHLKPNEKDISDVILRVLGNILFILLLINYIIHHWDYRKVEFIYF